ncbi:MAG: DUF1353 domain-containing protein [Rhodocyclaceae bacterium]|nr:DUF1353 domain-containing protein [Rhodocyclaceae bacterium]
MSSFTTPAILEIVGANRWRLAEPFEYHVGAYPSEEVVRVPAGFETDLASIPRLFWPILPPQGRYAKAAILHDWLYALGPAGDAAARRRADEIFLEAMAVLGCPAWQRRPIYWAVRLFGGAAFGRSDHPFDVAARQARNQP